MSYRADRFTVVLDTNVLVGALIRDMVLSLAGAGFFRPRWSLATMNEFERVLTDLRPDISEIGARQRANIERAFPEGTIPADQALIDTLTLPDPKDRHVLAAAIRIRAAVIVTDNLKDFPPECLSQHEVEAISADSFIADAIDLGGPEAVAALRIMRERFRKPEMDAEALILRIEQIGLTQTATMLQPYKSLL